MSFPELFFGFGVYCFSVENVHGNELGSRNVNYFFSMQATVYPGLCQLTTQGGLGFDYWVNVSVSQMWLWLLQSVPERDWSMNKVFLPFQLYNI